jgi:hypothetical protein
VFGKKIRLVKASDGRFYPRYKLLGIIPVNLGDFGEIGISKAEVDGHDVLKINYKGNDFLFGERIAQVPISDKWLERLGEYEIIDANDNIFALKIKKISLENDNGLLVGKIKLDGETGKIPFKPVSDDEAIIYGLGRDMGETAVVINENGAETIRLSGYLLKKKQ